MIKDVKFLKNYRQKLNKKLHMTGFINSIEVKFTVSAIDNYDPWIEIDTVKDFNSRFTKRIKKIS